MLPPRRRDGDRHRSIAARRAGGRPDGRNAIEADPGGARDTGDAARAELSPRSVAGWRRLHWPQVAAHIGQQVGPFIEGRHGLRAEVIAKYRIWICDQPDLMAALPELRGRDLVCWCAPKSCLGDLLLQLANPSCPISPPRVAARHQLNEADATSQPAPEPEGGGADPAPVPAPNRKPSRNARPIRPLSI